MRKQDCKNDKSKPRHWSTEDKFAVVLQAAALGKTELSSYCRKNGLSLEQISLWREACIRANDPNSDSVDKHKHSRLANNSMIGLFTTTVDGQLLFANYTLAKMYGYDSSDKMIAEGTLAHWADLQQREKMLLLLKKNGSVTNFEAITITKTKKEIHIIFSAELHDENISGMVYDITERKRAEQKINEYQCRLKTMFAQLTLAEERERRRIAADLHDHVGQSLALMRLQLEAARKSITKPNVLNTKKLDSEISAISQSLQDVIQDTRHLIFELSSPSLNEIGLSAALTEWVENTLDHKHNLQVSIIDHTQDITLDADLRAVLFRSVRELLTNVVKHAKATSVSVWLEKKANTLTIAVVDNGIGFDPDIVLQSVIHQGGFGLFSIQERTIDLGGKIKIVSQPGSGCSITLHIPIQTGMLTTAKINSKTQVKELHLNE